MCTHPTAAPLASTLTHGPHTWGFLQSYEPKTGILLHYTKKQVRSLFYLGTAKLHNHHFLHPDTPWLIISSFNTPLSLPIHTTTWKYIINLYSPNKYPHTWYPLMTSLMMSVRLYKQEVREYFPFWPWTTWWVFKCTLKLKGTYLKEYMIEHWTYLNQ